MNLPAYEDPGPSSGRLNRSDGSSDLQLHEFSLEGVSKPWAKLRLRSSAPSPKSLPIFFEGQKICGEVDLSLRKPEGIKNIVITVSDPPLFQLHVCFITPLQIKGIVTVGLEERIFMQLSKTIWSEEFGDPRNSSELKTKFSGKLVGSYQWPFSISLPSEAAIDEKIAKDLDLRAVERLPPNMQNSGWDSAICYRLSLNIKRHGMFRSDGSYVFHTLFSLGKSDPYSATLDRLSTLFGYTPLSRPDAPSDARRRAYKRNTPLLGPALDPIGWQALRRVFISGTLFRQREVTVAFLVSLLARTASSPL